MTKIYYAVIMEKNSVIMNKNTVIKKSPKWFNQL